MAELLLSQAELALRFRARQDMLPRCVACGSRIRRGDGVCLDCAAKRTPLGQQPPRAPVVVVRAVAPVPVEKPAAYIPGKVYYKPKDCRRCGRTFQPTGPRSIECKREDCR